MHVEDPEDLIREFIAAFNIGDLEGLARDLYEEDVVVVPRPGTEVMSGRAAVVRGLDVVPSDVVQSGPPWRLRVLEAFSPKEDTGEVAR